MRDSILLFDLGGVLVDLADPVEAIGLDMTGEEFWSTWLHSPLVRSFETGQLSTAEFVTQFGAELGFDEWPEWERTWQCRSSIGRYAAGVYQCLAELSRRCNH